MNKLTKKDIGKRFWVVPTGNNVSRVKGTNQNEPREVEIKDMRRTRGEFRFLDHGYVQEFSIPENTRNKFGILVNSGLNAGYILYESLSSYEKVNKAKAAISFINDVFRYGQNFEITLDDTIEAAKILGWKEQ